MKLPKKLCANKRLILNCDCYILILETINCVQKKKKKKKKEKNVAYNMSLQIMYI